MLGLSQGYRVALLTAFLFFVVTAVLVTLYLHPSDSTPPGVTRSGRKSGSPRADDLLIVPGTRVGDVWVGGEIDDAIPSLGKVEIAPRKDLIIYSSAELDIGVHGDHIQMVVVKSARFRTKEGVAVGGSVTPVVQAYGRRYEYTEKKTTPLQYTLDYWDRGISFSVERDQIVQIKVFGPLGGRS